MKYNGKSVCQAVLLVVENRETKEFNALFAQLPMIIGRGRTAAEAINELLVLSEITSWKQINS